MSNLVLASLPIVCPEIYLALGALFLLLYGAYRAPRAGVNLVLATVMILAVTGFFAYDGGTEAARIFSGMFVTSAFTVSAKILIVTASILVLLLATDWLSEEGGRPFEYAVLVLFATLGMMLMVSAGNLLALYMALEMMSLPLYVLASFDRDNSRSSEAGLKYFVLGSLASGMILFGISLVYGFAGTISFQTLGTLFAQQPDVSRAVVIGLVFVMVGFCFKLSAAPFHMWTPDVYEGAPTPVTAFFSTAPKVAAMALLARLLLEPFAALHGQWQQVLIAAALLSMIVGAFGAITQTNIKRLLAYSSIGHVGFMLLGLAAGSQAGVQAVGVYLVLYVFMSVGMFGCILISGREQIKDFAGLGKTHPLLAASIALLMFSMAGIPPMSGFFAKYFILFPLFKTDLVAVAVASLLISVVSAYYYIKVVKVMYFDEPTGMSPVTSSPLVIVATAIGTLVTLGFFLMPSPLMKLAGIAAKALVP